MDVSNCLPMKIAILSIVVFFFSISAFSQKLIVELSGIRNQEGWIRLAFFRNDVEFDAEEPSLVRIIDKTKVQSGNLVVTLDSIQPGVYGIALLDDENKNGKLDYSFIVPKEGVGFSNYILRGIRKPRFGDFSFLIRKDATLRIRIRLIYYGAG